MEKCYANKLGDCKGKISREHYISQSLLKHLGDIEITGFIWQKADKMKIQASALTANILCEHHNNILTVIDGPIVETFKIFELIGDQKNLSFKNRRFNIDGDLFQRWILKFLCGMLASGNAMKGHDAIFDKEIPLEWLNYLFGLTKFPAGTGFHMKSVAGLQFETSRRIGFSPLNKKNSDEVVGCHFDFQGYPFYLFMEPQQSDDYLCNPRSIDSQKRKFKDSVKIHYSKL